MNQTFEEKFMTRCVVGVSQLAMRDERAEVPVKVQKVFREDLLRKLQSIRVFVRTQCGKLLLPQISIAAVRAVLGCVCVSQAQRLKIDRRVAFLRPPQERRKS